MTGSGAPANEGELARFGQAARERGEPWLEAVHELVDQAPADQLRAYAEAAYTALVAAVG